MTTRTKLLAVSIATLALLTTVGCGGGGNDSDAEAADASTSSTTTGATDASPEEADDSEESADTAGGDSGDGTFSTGRASIVTPSETIDLNFDSGSFVELLGSNGSVSVNWSDSDDNNLLGLLGDGDGGYKLSVIGLAAPNGITQNECVATVTKDEASGVEGTYTCTGDLTGTFAAH